MKTTTNGRSSTRATPPAPITDLPIDTDPTFARSRSPEVSIRQRVAERAYLLYLARGEESGDALADWLEAERQITEEAGIVLG
jgi:hypothetical protein